MHSEQDVLATPLDLEGFLSSCYLFHDLPARREDFLAVSGAAQFPMKFCKHRWLENVRPAQRVIDILPNLATFCSAAKNKSVTQPTCKSFDVLLKYLGDSLLRSKLEFFVSIAREMEPFLSLYQIDRPMIPFLFEDLGSLLKNLMMKIVKSDVLGDTATIKSVLHINLKDVENLKEPEKVDIGFCATRRSLSTKASDGDRYAFRMECQGFLIAMVLKLFDKAPVKYALVKNLSWLQPKTMMSTKGKTKERAERTASWTRHLTSFVKLAESSLKTVTRSRNSTPSSASNWSVKMTKPSEHSTTSWKPTGLIVSSTSTSAACQTPNFCGR